MSGSSSAIRTLPEPAWSGGMGQARQSSLVPTRQLRKPPQLAPTAEFVSRFYTMTVESTHISHAASSSYRERDRAVFANPFANPREPPPPHESIQPGLAAL